MFSISADIQYHSFKNIDPFIRELLERKIKDAMLNLDKDLRDFRFRYAGDVIVDLKLQGTISVTNL